MISSFIHSSFPKTFSRYLMKCSQNSQQSSNTKDEELDSPKCLKNVIWKYLRDYKLPSFKPSYHNLALPSKVAIKNFIKQSS
jgi:hypothetical protein